MLHHCLTQVSVCYYICSIQHLAHQCVLLFLIYNTVSLMMIINGTVLCIKCNEITRDDVLNVMMIFFFLLLCPRFVQNLTDALYIFNYKTAVSLILLFFCFFFRFCARLSGLDIMGKNG